MKKKIILSICGVLLVALGVLGIYFMSKSTDPVTIFKTTVNNVYSELESGLKKESTIDVNNFGLDAKLNIDTSIKELENLKNYSLDLKVASDMNAKRYFVGAGIVKENDKIIEALVHLLNNKGYLSIPDISTKLFDLGSVDEVMEFNELDFDIDNINKEISYIL